MNATRPSQRHEPSPGRFRRSSAQIALIALVLAAAANAAVAQDDFKRADGLAVYLGVMPAAIVRGHAADHPERQMHDGIPRGRQVYHIVAAVFDDATGVRIEDAAVEARVIPLALAGTSRRLEPMSIAGTVTYGNYFALSRSSRYTIELTIARPTVSRPIKLEFTYEHRAR